LATSPVKFGSAPHLDKVFPEILACAILKLVDSELIDPSKVDLRQLVDVWCLKPFDLSNLSLK
jgi:hypothetical protein